MLRAAIRVAVFAALAGGALSLSPAEAQQATAVEQAAEQVAVSVLTAEGLELSADLHHTYLAGRTMMVTLRIGNGQADALEFPKLDERPHLVSFELISAAGKKQNRFNTPPSEDEDLRWLIPPRGSRQVSLELPLSSTLRPGRYNLKVTVQHGEQPLVLGPVSVLIEAAMPVSADVTEAGASTLGWQLPWVHQGSDGHELYLHTTPRGRPDAWGNEWRLSDVDEGVEPQLALGRSTSGANRYVYWRSGPRGIAFARLEERKLRHEPRKVGLPYPAWDLLARGGADAVGGLHVPVWIPAPSGDAGEVRVVSIDTRGQPRFRRVVTLDARPSAQSWVDGAGRLRLLLHHDGKLDIYTVDPEADTELPAEGRRLLPQTVRAGEVQLLARPTSPERGLATGAVVSDRILGFVDQRLAAMTPPPVLGVRFGSLPDSELEAGGRALFAWLGNDGSASQGLSAIWLSLNGRVIATVPGVNLPAGHAIAQLLPRGYEPCVLISVDPKGSSWASSGAWNAPVALGKLGPYDAVRPDDDGQLWLVSIQARKGVEVQAVGPSADEPVGP